MAKTASDAYTGASTWVQNHASTIAGVAAGVVTFAACEAVTAGAGSIGCAMLAGAAGNAVSYAMDCGKSNSCSVGGAVGEIAEGAAMGALGGGLGKVAGVALRAIVPEAAMSALSAGASRLANAGREAFSSAADAAGSGLKAISRPVVSAARSLGNAVRGSCNSFTAATPVLLADGHTKPISELRVGDKVVSSDPATGETAARQVLATIVHSGPHRMVDVRESNGALVTATDHHPFFNVVTGSFTDAIDLRAGDRLHTADGRTITVASTHVHNENLTAYNLTVADIHTYYVLAGSDPILVHNANDACPRVFAVDSSGSATELPVHEIDSAIYPGVADNFNNAIGNGESPIVTRMVGRSAIRANRDAAQAGQPRPGTLATGMSWEEYPFASTEEGGSGATLRLIPRDENVSHGRDSLWPFLRDNGIGGGDQYYVGTR